MSMADRQTRNVSLPPHQDAFVNELVEAGRYRTASEVVREGLRLLEEAEHRRLLEEWIYQGLSEDDEERLPQDLKDRAKEHFQGLIDESLRDVRSARVTGGSKAMKNLREELKTRRG